MFNKITKLLVVTFIITFVSCSKKSPNKFSFNILQLNDVYEISPMNNGKVAGLARVATLRNQLLAENKNTISIMAGDFLSPSVIGTMKINGKRVSGKQMIETLNALQLDYAVFGNHEFDLKETMLQNRLNESSFNWISANTFHQTDSGIFNFEKNGKPIPEYIIHEFTNENGGKLKLGIIGVTLPFNKQDYVKYKDIFSSFEDTYKSIKNECDVVIGITHLHIEDDLKLAEKFPDLLMILGGHEHVNSRHLIGNVHVTKADANAKTVYVHRITVDLDNDKKTIKSELINITNSIEEYFQVKIIIDKWEKLISENLNNQGYNPDFIIYKTTDTLNILESAIRNGSTNFTIMVMKAYAYGYPEADAYLANSGSIRLDNILSGNIYEYDILKSFPYGGSLVVVEMTGKMLEKTLQISVSDNKNTGGFLQTGNINFENETWKVGHSKIIISQNYKVLMPSFLATGLEQNLKFLKDISSVKPETLGPNKVKNDVRDIVIDYFKNIE